MAGWSSTRIAAEATCAWLQLRSSWQRLHAQDEETGARLNTLDLIAQWHHACGLKAKRALGGGRSPVKRHRHHHHHHKDEEDEGEGRPLRAVTAEGSALKAVITRSPSWTRRSLRTSVHSRTISQRSVSGTRKW